MTGSCNMMKDKYVSVCSQSGQPGREQSLTDGTVCWEELNLLKSCLVDDSDVSSHPIVLTVDKNIVENAERALDAVDTYVSQECAAEVKPFLCVYFFGLMSDHTPNRVSFQPSASHCNNLRETTCKDAWNLAQFVGLELPECDEEFPSNTIPCNEERGKQQYLVAIYQQHSKNETSKSCCAESTCTIKS